MQLMKTTLLGSLHKLKVPMSTKTGHFLCKIANLLRKNCFQTLELDQLRDTQFFQSISKPSYNTYKQITYKNYTLTNPNVSNYLMNFYLFEEILTKLQRTLINISKQGIFMLLYNILLMESFFCHQSIMISLELCLDLKIFHS